MTDEELAAFMQPPDVFDMSSLRAIRDAAKSEPVTIGDEDGLRRAIQGVLWNASNFPAKVAPHMLGQDVGPLTKKVTDAVIAHLAAQPVTGSVEWGVKSITTGSIWASPSEAEARDDIAYHEAMVDPNPNATKFPRVLVKRNAASEWVKVSNE